MGNMELSAVLCIFLVFCLAKRALLALFAQKTTLKGNKAWGYFFCKVARKPVVYVKHFESKLFEESVVKEMEENNFGWD